MANLIRCRRQLYATVHLGGLTRPQVSKPSGLDSISLMFGRRDDRQYLHSSPNTSSEILAAAPPDPVRGTEPVGSSAQRNMNGKKSPLSRLSKANLLRSLFLGYCFTSPRLLKVLMGGMSIIVQSKSPFLNPDRNPLMRGVIRALVYDHFCAGTNTVEVKKTIKEIKSAGYAGVILGYGREIVVEPNSDDSSKTLSASQVNDQEDEHISMWLEGNLTTLSMIGENDYMNIKFTGAGPTVSQCLMDGTPPPSQLIQAVDTICTQARCQKSRIWIDAEQQVFQANIDAWTMDLMRRFNQDNDALVYTTIQTYLKGSRATLAKYMQVASDEGWTLGIKQVRGAYIASDVRDKIWATKAETDDSYNSIARDLLRKDSTEGVFPGFKGMTFPKLHLFLAGHNRESIRLATALVHELVVAGKDVPFVQYGQLQGMADDVSCELVQQYEHAFENVAKHKDDGKVALSKLELELKAAPEAYKCMNWGSVQECLHFLLRRAVENASAADRIKDGLGDLKAELKRRFLLR